MADFARFVRGLAKGAAGLFLAGAWALTGTAAQAQQCPDWSLGGINISTDADTAWVPQRFQMFAGGSLNLAACGTVQGHGNITAAPNFTIQYDDRGMGRDLELRVESECDTLMLINDQSAQWHFNDDEDGGLNPRIRLALAASGQYDVWVGTYGSQACQATLIAESFPGSSGGTGGGGAAVCPDWSLGGATLDLAAGANDSRSVIAGGSVDLFQNAAACGVEGHGYVAQAPDFTMTYDSAGRNETLSFAVQGQCDTLLLINDQAAQWHFNDDATDLQPRIEIPNAASGRYDIWVGTFGAATCDSTITFSAGGAGGGASK